MPATVRANTNTPTKTPTKATTDSRQVTPDSTPSRKLPHCLTCGLPRLGHPRSGCPLKSASPASETAVTTALSGLNLSAKSPTPDSDEEAQEIAATPVKDRPRRSLNKDPSPKAKLNIEDPQAAARARRRESAAAAKTAEVENNEEAQVDGAQKVIDWQKRSGEIDVKKENKSPKPLSRIMPGTLAPEQYLSVNTIAARVPSRADVDTKEDIPLESSESQKTDITPASSQQADTKESILASTPPSQAPASAVKPLTRTGTTLSQADFLSSLQPAASANARLYIFPTKDIQSVRAGANKVDLFSEIVDVKSSSDETLLVLGRDKDSVRSLVKKLEKDCKGKGGNGFKALAGGAVMGAAATFAGLATM